MTPKRLVDCTGFATSLENMRYDETLLHTLSSGFLKLRTYEWTAPGITHSYRQPQLPGELRLWDHSQRITGGGILFHSPGDLVFSVVGELTDPRLPSGLKAKLNFVADSAVEALAQVGVTAFRNPSLGKSENLAYCNTYQSPYEVWVGNDKIVAMTLRRFKSTFIIQGLFHLKSNADYFKLPDHYANYLSYGLPDAIEIETLINAFSGGIYSNV